MNSRENKPQPAADSLDRLFTITCRKCQKTSPVEEWQRTALYGKLPFDTYQCLACRHAFRRQARRDRKDWEPYYECVPIASFL